MLVDLVKDPLHDVHLPFLQQRDLLQVLSELLLLGNFGLFLLLVEAFSFELLDDALFFQSAELVKADLLRDCLFEFFLEEVFSAFVWFFSDLCLEVGHLVLF